MPPQQKTGTEKTLYLETLGCAKNRVDSEIMLGTLQAQGYKITPDPAAAQVIVVNTCAFLTAASEESINRILELSDHRGNGQLEKLVCAGCLSERYRETLLDELPEVDGILGSSDFGQIGQLLDELYAGKASSLVHLGKKPHYAHYENLERVQTTPGHYVYVKVAEGCSNMCSFCNIPFLRGYFSSRTPQAIVSEVQGHLSRGVKEINLISQDTSSYGVDLKDGTNLEVLLRGLDALPGDFWLRIFYAYPNTFTSEAIQILANASHIVPYLDMPFQHISSPVLKAMNRRITEKEIRNKLEELKKAIPHLALRTTFITGFPSETEADFERLLDFVKEGWFDHVGVFPYSHEDNITSSKLGDPISATEKRARADAVFKAQQAVSFQRNKNRVGEVLKVLVEGESEETELLLKGRAAFQGPEVDGIVYINEGMGITGSFQDVEITEAHHYDLVGKIVNN